MAVPRQRGRHPGPGEIWRAVREADWIDRLWTAFFGCLALVFAGFWAWVLPVGIDAAWTVVAGKPGTVEVHSCEPAHRGGWTCIADFTADDGAFQVRRKRVAIGTEERPGPMVPGRASGPHAHAIWPDGEYNLAGAIALAVGLPFVVWLVWRWTLEMLEPLGGWPARKPAASAGPGPPRPDNRRRRKRRSRGRRPRTPRQP